MKPPVLHTDEGLTDYDRYEREEYEYDRMEEDKFERRREEQEDEEL